MNEVRSSQIASQLLVSSASSQGAKETQKNPGGNNVPQEAVKAENIGKAGPQKPSMMDLGNAVSDVADFVQSVQRDLQFTVDQELGRTVVKVLDGDSGEVIRQIPDDIFLELARKLKDDGEFRLLNALG